MHAAEARNVVVVCFIVHDDNPMIFAAAFPTCLMHGRSSPRRSFESTHMDLTKTRSDLELIGVISKKDRVAMTTSQLSQLQGGTVDQVMNCRLGTEYRQPIV